MHKTIAADRNPHMRDVPAVGHEEHEIAGP